jgi:hypothetical protein
MSDEVGARARSDIAHLPEAARRVLGPAQVTVYIVMDNLSAHWLPRSVDGR